jgi:hypothetical protein
MLAQDATESPTPKKQPLVETTLRWAERPLAPWHKRGLVILAAAAVLFGVITEVRTALLEHRKGDLNVFLRAAWAIRSATDIYTVTDDNGFHYLYPPLFAIVLAPLADAPAGFDRTGMLPYAVSAGLCYALNLVCLFVAVNWLANSLQRNGVLKQCLPGSRGWWALRVIPILVCLSPIGHTLMRGQAGLLLLLLICGMIAAVLAGRRRQAGLWLAGAICLKIIPAFLLIYPLWRRDLRMLAGCAIGLILGLVAIPALVMGPARAADCYREWTNVMLLPALDRGDDRSRAKEVIEMTATDSQSILVVAHNTLYPERKTRPTKADAETRLAALAIGGALTLATLLAGGWRRLSGVQEAAFLGMLVIDMLLMSPVCHLHYFCLSVPLVMVLIALRWQQTDRMRWLPVLLVANVVANTLPHFPGLEPVRDLGMAMYAALALWFAGAVVLMSVRFTQMVTKVSAEEAPIAA